MSALGKLSKAFKEAVEAGLDMSTDARMARARAQGFDVGTPLYHGSDETFGAFDPAAQRQSSTRGHYFADSEFVAGDYGDNVGEYVAGGRGLDLTDDAARDEVYSIWKKYYDDANPNDLFEMGEDEAFERLTRAAGESPELHDALDEVRALEDYGEWGWSTMLDLDDLSPKGRATLSDAWEQVAFQDFWEKAATPAGYNDGVGPAWRDDLISALEQEGYDKVSFLDDAGMGGLSKSTVVFEPRNIRRPGAAFNPANRDSSDLLASMSGAAVGLGALAAPEEAEALDLDPLYQFTARRAAKSLPGMGTSISDQIAAARQAREARDFPAVRNPALLQSAQAIREQPVANFFGGGVADYLESLSYGDQGLPLLKSSFGAALDLLP